MRFLLDALSNAAGPVGISTNSGTLRRLRRSAMAAMGAVFAALVLASLELGRIFDLGWHFPVLVAVGFLPIASLVVLGMPWHPYARFGLANVVTTIRAALTMLTGALIAEFLFAEHSVALSWLATAIAGVALTLDGADGFVARRGRMASRLGAIFDMEIDALLILFLAMLVAASGKVGVWVVLIGLMRYAFAAAQLGVSRIQGTLAPSMRRKLVCAAQGVLLCLMISPFVSAPAAHAMGLIALITLTWSFAVDVVALARQSAPGYRA